MLYRVGATSLGANARTLLVQLRGSAPDGAPDDEGEIISDAEVLQPLGLFARPVVGTHTEAMGADAGDEVWVSWLGDKTGGGGSVGAFAEVDAPAGTTLLYGAKEAAARITLTPDGDATVACKAARSITLSHPSGASITIDGNGAIAVSAAAGQDITFNGGTKRAARIEDALDVGTLVATAGPWPVVFTYVPGTGTPLAAPPGGVSLQGVIATLTGAERVKA